MSFRTMIVLASLAIVSSGAARAADLTSTYNDPPAFQWSGAYIGAHGGIASAKAPNPFRSGNGFDVGIQAGYNIQAGPAVFGAEIEGSYLGGTRHDVTGGTLKEKWRAAAKAKAGLSFDQTLVYGTAGVALTKFDKSDSLNSADERRIGYLVGAGVEQGFAGGLSARLEYNYVRTPDVETTSIYGQSKKDINSQELKAGINYRF